MRPCDERPDSLLPGRSATIRSRQAAVSDVPGQSRRTEEFEVWVAKASLDSPNARRRLASMLTVPNRARTSIAPKRTIEAMSPFTSRWPAAQIETPQRNGWRVMRSMPRTTSGLSRAPSWRTLVGFRDVRPGTISSMATSCTAICTQTAQRRNGPQRLIGRDVAGLGKSKTQPHETGYGREAKRRPCRRPGRSCQSARLALACPRPRGGVPEKTSPRRSG